MTAEEVAAGFFPVAFNDGEKGLQLLFEQFQNGFVQIFHRKAIRGSGENGVVTGNGPEDAFRFPQRVQQTRDQLCGARTGMDHHNSIVVVDI